MNNNFRLGYLLAQDSHRRISSVRIAIDVSEQNSGKDALFSIKKNAEGIVKAIKI